MHNICATSRQSCIVRLNIDAQTQVLVALKGCGPERSELAIPRELKMSEQNFIEAELRLFETPPILAKLSCTASTTQHILQNWPMLLNIAQVEESSCAEYEIRESHVGLELIDLHNATVLQYTRSAGAKAIHELFVILKKVLTWHRFRRLENLTQAQHFAAANVDFHLIDQQHNKIKLPTDDSALPYNCTAVGELAYFPVCRVQNNTESKLFFHLFYLSRSYSIELLATQEVAPSNDWATLWGKYDGPGLFLPAGLDETNEIFKVIISTEEIQTWLIAQAGFEVGGATRGSSREIGYRPSCANAQWVAKGFELRLLRENVS